jgi:BolA protein
MPGVKCGIAPSAAFFLLAEGRGIPILHGMASRSERLHACLLAGFAPLLLEVEDDSARHAGHAGARPEGETHFSIHLVSAAFRGQSRVARARAVHEALAVEFAGGLHALALKLQTPEEHATVF